MQIRLVILVAVSALIMHCCKKSSKDDTPGGLNPYDGKYRIEGTLTDHQNGAFVWPGNTYLYTVETLSPTQVKLISTDLGFSGHLLKNGINLTYYAEFGLTVTFDLATNKITSITNPYGQPSPTNKRSAILDPSGVNTWDPVTKNIKIKFWMDEVGFPGHHTSFDETWVYIGAR